MTDIEKTEKIIFEEMPDASLEEVLAAHVDKGVSFCETLMTTFGLKEKFPNKGDDYKKLQKLMERDRDDLLKRSKKYFKNKINTI